MKKACILALCLCFCLAGCRKTPEKQTQFIFDTVCDITIYDGGRAVLSRAFELCREYDLLFSRTNPESQVYKANNAGGAPVEIDPRLTRLLELCVEMSEKSDGAFDVTVGAATQLWDYKNKTVPAQAQIDRALTTIGYKNIVLQGNTLTLKNGAQLDLGAIAKGYVADLLCDFLREQGVQKAIINLGGNIILFGGAERWKVGVQKPFGTEQELAAMVHTADISVVTSGIYQRYFERDGLIYHHILNPYTGRPADSGLDSVTVLAQSSVVADAASTACMVFGLQPGMEFIASLPGVDAVFINKQGEIVATPGISPTDNGQTYLEIVNI